MKTVRDTCQLPPNALSVKLSDQIEQLDELISAQGNGAVFFDRTFITRGMQDMLTEDTVDMINLVYQHTEDEQVYAVTSRRMKDRYDIFGSLPNKIEDYWIESVEELEERMDEYMHFRENRRTAPSRCGITRRSTQTRIDGNCADGCCLGGTSWTSCWCRGEYINEATTVRLNEPRRA
jgi:hypothetical protein